MTISNDLDNCLYHKEFYLKTVITDPAMHGFDFSFPIQRRKIRRRNPYSADRRITGGKDKAVPRPELRLEGSKARSNFEQTFTCAGLF